MTQTTPLLITGAAGFIGFHTARQMLEQGIAVHGVDNLNDYYDPALKEARLDILKTYDRFTFTKADISDKDAMEAMWRAAGGFKRVIHLAAQAGVRYSLVNPYAYITSNVMGQTILLELCRHEPDFEHFVYASSSSVYGGNTDYPFKVEDRTDNPLSIYAATKKSCELIAQSYKNMFAVPSTGLRFFTVYGPWGRPDMSLYIFAKAILDDNKVPVFNNGKMKRDFTYIDDIVAGIDKALNRSIDKNNPDTLHKVYNLGNNHSEELMDFLEIIQTSLDRKADIDFQGMQNGDVTETYADITASQKDLGYAPDTRIQDGVPRFIQWFLEYHEGK